MPDYTPQQRACIEKLIGPVDVSAGAGSGKTFTLTQRIASALEDPNSGVDDIDQVCAITFTEKAAAELKGRVRSTLRAKGLFDQALKVDSAWISTIHGMCARILRAQALELGIDPSFGVLVGSNYQKLFDQAFNAVLEEDSQGQQVYKMLSEAYPMDSAGFGTSLKDVVTALLDASLGLPDGALGLQRASADPIPPRAWALRLLESYQIVYQALGDQKPGKQRDEALLQIEKAMPALEAFLSSDRQDYEGLLQVLDQCAMVRKFTAKALKPLCEDYQEVHCQVIRAMVMCKSEAVLDVALDFAEQVRLRFAAEKRRFAMLDNNDLIVLAAQALDNPQIAAEYSDRFRLIMVDEFQDTDQLQLRLIKHMAGPGMKYLCTVGDAQQSIYGFRGADIAVYFDYQDQLENPQLKEQGADPAKLQLSRNFRSHADVLAFVRAVCSQRRVFGTRFLDLEDVYPGTGYLAHDPRIQICLSMAAVGRGPGCNMADARQAQANQIAQYFARMKQQGHSLSDMVLLLGSTSQAQLYAQAIRDQVGSCIIAGGSLFANADEVAVVGAILRAIINPKDTQTLFRALSSPAFSLTPGDYLTLATYEEEFAYKKQSLDRGLSQLIEEMHDGVISVECSSGLLHALKVLDKSQKALRYSPIHQVLLETLVDSGWICRLESEGAEGLAQVGNILKAVRLAERLETQEYMGAASLVKMFEEELATLREPPGALNAQGQEAVRIMTIHASKGLEFPIVALADFEASGRSSSVVSRKIEGVPFVSCRIPFDSIAGKDLVAKAFSNFVVEEEANLQTMRSADPATMFALLSQNAQEAEAEERQRLFYVGATRAKEALCVFMAAKPDKDGYFAPEEGIAADLRWALFQGEAFPLECSTVSYGGSQPAQFHVAIASLPQVQTDQQEAPASEPGAAAVKDVLALGEVVASDCSLDLHEQTPLPFVVPVIKPFRRAPLRVPQRDRQGMCSYSSLAGEDPSEVQEALGFLPMSMGFFDGEEWLIEADEQPLRRKAEDADKATDFGTALHLLAQLAATAGADTARNRIQAVAARNNVKDVERLQQALERWLSSEVCARAFGFDLVQPEVPFALTTKDGVLEGQIDLMCTNRDSLDFALVVDYKTGGSPDESQAQLREKHQLQAQCYAQAVLAQGYAKVELVFFRVEQGNAVTFSYSQSSV